MGSYREIDGNLITLAKQGEFDVIVHGCNCFCIQGAGIAASMSKEFDTDNPNIFPLEAHSERGDINKLGQIQWARAVLSAELSPSTSFLDVVNAYTQYRPGADARVPAVSLAMTKVNEIFKGKRIGLPLIGCGIGGLQWNLVKTIFQRKLPDCDVTVVHFKP